MEEVIDLNQTYCVPDRLISGNAQFIRDNSEVSGSLGIVTCLISMDSAIDRTSVLVANTSGIWFQPRIHSHKQGYYLSSMLYFIAM